MIHLKADELQQMNQDVLQYQKTKDIKIRNKYLVMLYPHIQAMCRQKLCKAGIDVDSDVYDDMCQEAVLLLIKCFADWKIDRVDRFYFYCMFVLKQKITVCGYFASLEVVRLPTTRWAYTMRKYTPPSTHKGIEELSLETGISYDDVLSYSMSGVLSEELNEHDMENNVNVVEQEALDNEKLSIVASLLNSLHPKKLYLLLLSLAYKMNPCEANMNFMTKKHLNNMYQEWCR